MESVDVKLARIEEGMVALHGKIDSYHKSISGKIEKVDKHEVSIAVLKRDRWWLTTIAAVVGGAFAKWWK